MKQKKKKDEKIVRQRKVVGVEDGIGWRDGDGK